MDDNFNYNYNSNKNNSSRLITFGLVGIIAIVALIAFKVIPIGNSSDRVVFNEKNVRVQKDNGIQLSINSNSGNVRYKSSDINIASVNEYSGYVIANKEGTVTITAYDGNKTIDTCNVEVYEQKSYVVHIESLKLSENDMSLYVGDSRQLKVTISPSSATNRKLTWSTSNNSVATISNGVVTATGVGTAVIKVRTENGIEVACRVTVKNKNTVTPTPTPSTKCTLTYNANGGTVTPTSKTVNKGDAIGTLPTPSRSGYNFTGWYTAIEGGSKVAATTRLETNAAIYAHWTKIETSPTKGKTAIFIGDSITAGKYGNYSWANYIGEKYDLKKSVNAGLSGGVLSTFRGEKWLVDVVKKYKGKKYDYVILHGGINDIALVARLGEPKGTLKAKDFSGKYDTNTFIGGLETYIYTAKKQWPNAKIGFIINYRTPADSAVDPKSSEYYSLIKKVCKKWGIKYIDLYAGKTTSGKKFSDLLKVNTKTYIQDGTHLNKAGYKVISPYIYNWMKTL